MSSRVDTRRMDRRHENLFWTPPAVERQEREALNGHRGAVLWFTGLSGAGKTTLAQAVARTLHDLGCRTFVLDGDNIRHGLCSDLGFSAAERIENNRRLGETVKLFAEAGMIALAASISPFRAQRDSIRALMGACDFLEIYCRCPLSVCEQRDVKGLYRKARAGEIAMFTGISSPYEEPLAPDLVADSANSGLNDLVTEVIGLLQARGCIGMGRSGAPQ